MAADRDIDNLHLLEVHKKNLGRLNLPETTHRNEAEQLIADMKKMILRIFAIEMQICLDK